MSIKTVLLIGAGGSLGSYVLSSLQKSFTVTILTRQSSKSVFPPGLKVITVPDSYPVPDLVSAFTGQDAVVSTITTANFSVQKHFVDAAAQAGVRRYVPAEFGSDTYDGKLSELVPAIYGEKVAQMKHLEAACERSGGRMSWTAMATGAFFDWMFSVSRGAFGHIDLAARKAEVFDDGEKRFSVTNMAQIAVAFRRALEREEETRNRFLLIQSFVTTQNEIVKVLEKVVGAKWEVEKVDSKKFMEEHIAKAQTGDHDAMYNVIWGVCVTNSDWTRDKKFANELLGLEEEDLEESLRLALANLEAGKV
ncbi:hypothetical protein MMC10_011144 [Thelotrema lepadinum]|nr:hypothetical protein [Thelotrema lepadinum]